MSVCLRGGDSGQKVPCWRSRISASICEDGNGLGVPSGPFSRHSGAWATGRSPRWAGALRERLRLQFAKTIPEFDDLDLLQIVGSSQIGRLRYSLRESIEESVPTQDLAEVLTYRGSADLFAHLLERFAQYSGISGIQPKVLVRDVAAPGKVTHRGATHIVKSFDPNEYPGTTARTRRSPGA